jgi:hypothetical protein
MKSQTPLKIGIGGGVYFNKDYYQQLIDQEHEIYELSNPVHTLPIIESLDIILLPQCYNHQGEVTKKQLDLYTKATRARMRAEKKLAKLQEAEEKRKAKGRKPVQLDMI